MQRLLSSTGDEPARNDPTVSERWYMPQRRHLGAVMETHREDWKERQAEIWHRVCS